MSRSKCPPPSWGAIHRADGRKSVVNRLVEMLKEANSRGSRFVVFPELALTAFFPRWWMEEPGRGRRVLRGANARAPRPCRCSSWRAPGASATTSATPSWRRRRAARAVQHLDPGRAGRPHRRQVPQGPPAGPQRAFAGRALPALREALFRGRRFRLQRLEDVRRGTCWSGSASATTGAGLRPSASWH